MSLPKDRAFKSLAYISSHSAKFRFIFAECDIIKAASRSLNEAPLAL